MEAASVKATAPKIAGGNPMFNLKEAEAAAPRAMAAVTAEDLAFERELMALEATTVPEVNEGSNYNILKKEKSSPEMLSEVVDDYKPAKSLHELRDQVFYAKQMGCDSIEASPEIIKYFTKPHFPDDVGYFLYDSIKVWIPGFFQTHQHNDSASIESKLFGKREAKT